MRGPIWPKVPAGFVRSILAGHSSLGLFLAALAYLICVTGTLVVFADELRRWEQPGAPEFSTLTAGAIDRAADAALAEAGDHPVKSVTVYMPTKDRPRAMVWLFGGETFSKGWFIDAEGRLARPDEPHWNGFMAELHASLHMHRIGFIIVGLVGVWMLGLAVSGLLAHPRIFRDAFRMRWGGSRRLQEADLHNRLSVWGLPFNVIVSGTGAYIGLVGLLVLILGAVAPQNEAATATEAARGLAVKPDDRPAPRLSLEEAVRVTRSDEPNGAPFVATLSRPGTRGQSMTVYTLLDRRLVYGELYTFGPDMKRTRVGWSDGPAGVQAYASAYRLHFGNFGGMPVKILYFVLGFGLSVVTSSGVAIWLARRRDQGRPAPRWERIWISTVWGTMLATSLSALTRQAFDWEPLYVFCAVQALAWAAGLAAPDALRLGRGMKAGFAISLAALVGVHLAVHRANALQPASFAVDLICLAVAALFALYLGKTRKPVRKVQLQEKPIAS
jgi:uncharacterized iron-regulated membrane protein